MNNKVNVFNMTLPAEGPVTVPVNVDFALLNVTSNEIDLTQLINDKWVSFFSGAYIDNKDNPNDLRLLVNSTFQRIDWPAGKQGWVPLYIPNPPIITLSQGAPTGQVQIQFVNFPVWPFLIDDAASNSLNSPQYIRASGATMTDRSKALSGGSEVLFAAGDATAYAIVYNPIGNSDMRLNLAGGDASISAITIAPGGSYEFPAGVANAVTIDGTAADVVVAYSGV